MYTYTIKGQTLDVIRMIIPHNNKVMWRYEINNGGSEDWYSTKREAKGAGIEWIKENF